MSPGMPFIRYDTGDRARLEEQPSAANGYRLRVSSLNPRRKPDYLVAEDGNRVVAIDLTPAEDKLFEGVDEFQFFQDTPGEVLIRYVTSKGATDNEMQRLAKILQKKSHGRLRFSSVEVESITSGRGGKRAFDDQRLLTELD